MGMAVYSLDIPVIKSTSGILLLSGQLTQFDVRPCIRCGRCNELPDGHDAGHSQRSD